MMKKTAKKIVKKSAYIALLLTVFGLAACQSDANKTAKVAPKPTLPGVYTGMLPCEDCQGISTRLTLYKNGEFSKTDTYIDKPDSKFTENGTYQKSPNGKRIMLTGSTETVESYQIGNNTLTLQTMGMQTTTGGTVGKYILRKQAASKAQ